MATATIVDIAEPIDQEKTLERIRRYIEQPPENSRVFVITPMIAETILREYNIDNRPKKPEKDCRVPGRYGGAALGLDRRVDQIFAPAT
jgi:hypothetical protein